METRNNKIIQAIIRKARKVCPGSLALIGIYGSCLTGDIHEKSDLDLMILINDERGYQLAAAFIQEDVHVGHDLYCTTWDMLEQDAAFPHPHISKLMDSKIIYCADDRYLQRLEELRQKALCVQTQSAAEKALQDAEHHYTLAMVAKDLSKIRVHAGYVIHSVLNAVALLNNRYFRLGIKRVFDEIDTMEHKPDRLYSMVDAVITADNAGDLKTALTEFLQAALTLQETSDPSPIVYPGTYEEMFSNWRNKMHLAAETGNRYLAFSSMCAFDAMLKELGFSYDVLAKFHPYDLTKSAQEFDRILESYRKEYDRAGIAVQSYRDIDAFTEAYI